MTNFPSFQIFTYSSAEPTTRTSSLLNHETENEYLENIVVTNNAQLPRNRIDIKSEKKIYKKNGKDTTIVIVMYIGTNDWQLAWMISNCGKDGQHLLSPFLLSTASRYRTSLLHKVAVVTSRMI